MLKDIAIPVVEGIIVAIIKEGTTTEPEYNVYLINTQNIPLKNVLVSSTGYGVVKEEQVTTSTLRFYFEEVETASFVKIEGLTEELFAIANEYWVSYYIDGTIYDKKYIFLPETITENNFTIVPIILKKGVMIK